MISVTSPEDPQLIEGVGDEIVIIIVSLLCVVIPAVAYVLYRKRQQPGIHPDFAATVESTRRQLNRQNGDNSTQSQARPQARHLNSGQLTCPICLGEAAYAVETNCGHLYCGHCIITYWHHRNWLGAVPCPSCRTRVTLLLLNFTPVEAAENTAVAVQIRHDVDSYNRRFSGAPRPIMDYIRDLPTLLRHAWGEFFTVGGIVFMYRVRVIIIFLLALVYFISPLDILPETVFGVLGFLDDFVVVLLLAVYISIIYRQVVASRAARAGNTGTAG